MLLILYKPDGNIVDHKDLLVENYEAEDYLQDFPGSICVSYSNIISLILKIKTIILRRDIESINKGVNPFVILI